jgi:hypothetical protein
MSPQKAEEELGRRGHTSPRPDCEPSKVVWRQEGWTEKPGAEPGAETELHGQLVSEMQPSRFWKCFCPVATTELEGSDSGDPCPPQDKVGQKYTLS